ncbi:MAG: molybdopterin molybdenumtransferase MoeA [Rhodobacteraceae bacterium]|nr:MAG: molybdopterin molybdenumtransferase MoeA [Paracoccaceae bacterium]
MISVETALAQIFALVSPVGTETVGLADAHGRILRRPLVATRNQPPFAASSMDGYAVCNPVRPSQRIQVIGEAAAGHAFKGVIAPGQALRIFTGAPIPAGADRVIIQEDVTRDGDVITIGDTLDSARYIRDEGIDFKAGFTLTAPRRLTPSELALIAAMNISEVSVSKRPTVAIISSGDELVMPGETPRPDQIIASNVFALKALAEQEGASAYILPIASDTEDSLRAVLALAEDADLVITIGGASVGDHDLVGPVLEKLGAERSFYKVAMRPGKPLMAATMGKSVVLGLPGNPVSAIVCGHVFMRPALRAMLGLPATSMIENVAKVTVDLCANGPRAHYLRAILGTGGTITPLPDQDSALLRLLTSAEALMIRPAHDAPRKAGEQMKYIAL